MSEPEKVIPKKPAGCPMTDEEWRAAVEAGAAEVRERRTALERAELEREAEEIRSQLQLQREIEEREAAGAWPA